MYSVVRKSSPRGSTTGLRLPPLTGADDPECSVQDRVPGARRVKDHDVLPAVQAHPLQQGELEEVRAAEGDVDLLRGKQQLAGGVIGEQQEKILGQQHGPETRTEPVRGATLCSRAARCRRSLLKMRRPATTSREWCAGSWPVCGRSFGCRPVWLPIGARRAS